VNLIYTSTKRGDSLRTLVRDVYVHEAESSEHHEFLRTSDLHPEFWRDISLEYFRLKNGAKSIGEVCGLKIGRDKKVSKCNYHRRKPTTSSKLCLRRLILLLVLLPSA